MKGSSGESCGSSGFRCSVSDSRSPLPRALPALGLRSSEACFADWFCWVSFHRRPRALQIRELRTTQESCGPKTRRMLAP